MLLEYQLDWIKIVHFLLIAKFWASPKFAYSPSNIFTLDLRDWDRLSVELSPPKPLDQSKNVTVRTFHTWPGSVHEHIFLALGGARGPGDPVGHLGPKKCAHGQSQDKCERSLQ